MLQKIGFVCLSIILQLHYCACIECYTCSDAAVILECKSIIQCPTGTTCHSDWKSNRYNLGCISSTLCPTTTGGSLVGRSLSAPAQNDCSECCSTNNCNRQLCQRDTYGCHDSGDIDCATTGALVDICSLTDHAKIVCKRFCGLCNLVDGGWSNWTGWSSCSLTCGNGTSIRERSCSNPAPANGGSNCSGVSHERQACFNGDRCPVNGGWSQWSSWRACSVTCGIGLQRRDRSCSNPYPSNSGSHCFGDSHDYNICQPSACQDGGWTEWSGWSTCSTTCGPGLQTSSRSCTNPAPSRLGKACVGDGKKVQLCTVKRCEDQVVGFVVNSLVNITYGNAIFGHVISNHGGGYNASTGVFTCSVPGGYAFSFTILKEYSDSLSYADCYIIKNNDYLVQAYIQTNSSLVLYPGSVTAYVHLVTGDRVRVGGCTSIDTLFHNGPYSSFSGYLMHAD